MAIIISTLAFIFEYFLSLLCGSLKENDVKRVP
jgi:hypothetical protein